MDAADFYWRLTDCVRRLKDQNAHLVQPFCSRHSLTPLQLRIIMALRFNGAQTVSALAKRTCMAGANNSALCKRLAESGLVQRRRGADDERQVVVSLTAEGQQVAEGFARVTQASYQQLNAMLTEEDRAVIMAGLERLLTVVEQYDNNEETAI